MWLFWQIKGENMSDITIDTEQFLTFIIETLNDEQMMILIEEYEEAVGNWDFVHKGYSFFRNIVQGNKREYKEYLEDMVILKEEHSIVGIMDELEDE
jgi:hypothetical protein